MTTAYIRPTAAGDETSIASQLPDSGAHWDKVDEATADGDTTKVFAVGTVYQRDLYNLANPELSGTINWIKAWIVCKELYTGFAKTAIKTGETVYDGSEQALTTSYANYSTQYTTNPKTGVAWTWDDLDALQAGVSLKTNGEKGDAANCTQVFVEIDYTVVTGWQGIIRLGNQEITNPAAIRIGNQELTAEQIDKVVLGKAEV